MGYRGKVADQARARTLRAEGWTYGEICSELGVSRSSVSLWVRDVEVPEAAWSARVAANRNRGARPRRPHRQALEKQAEIERFLAEGRARIGRLSDREFLVAGAALYAGEGGKTRSTVSFANSDPSMIEFFLAWLRRFFPVDERRLRLRLYLHEGLGLAEANRFWASLTEIPLRQFNKPYRAVADPTIRRAKHAMGCPRIDYSSASTHREIMGLVSALLSCQSSIRGSSAGRAIDC